MALPVTITGISTAVAPVGPFKAASGNFYFFGCDGTTATTLQAYQATAPDVAWASIATKTGFTTAILNIAAYQVGSVIHMLVQDGTMSSSVATKYVSYDMSTDTFLATTETVSAASAITGQAVAGWGCSIAVLSNGSVMPFYNGPQTLTSSTNRARVYYRTRFGPGAYQAETQVDANIGNDNTYPNVVLGSSNRVHFFWSDGGVTAYRTRTFIGNMNAVKSPVSMAYPGNGVSYDRSGTTKVVVTNNSLGAQYTARHDSSDDPTATFVSQSIATAQTPHRIAVDTSTNEVTVVYRSSTDSDLYAIKSTDDGATFGSPVSVFVGTVSNADASLSKGQVLYTRGGNTVFPYIVNDNGTLKYNEYVTSAVGVSGTLAVTEAKDTTALSGSNSINGVLTVSEAADVAALTDVTSRPWTPLDLGANLLEWLDATDATTITVTGSGVSTWTDKSSYGRHGTQTVDGNRPPYAAGKVTFGDFCALNLPAGMPAEYDYIFVGKTSVSTVSRSMFFHDGSHIPLIIWDNAFGRLIGFYGLGIRVGGDTWLDSETAFVYGSMGTSANCFIAKNGGPLVDTNGPAETPDIVTYGRMDNANPFGDVYQIILVPRNSSLVVKQLLEGYVAWKHSLQALLPSDHPYKTTPPVVGAPSVVSGTLAATEAVDTASFFSAPGVSGTLSTTEPVDAAALTAANNIVLLGGNEIQFTFGSSTFDVAFGQSFTSIGTVVTALTPYIARAGAPTDTMVAQVWTSTSGMPGTLLGTSSPILGSSMVPTTSAPLQFDFSPPVTVQNGVQYVAVFTRTGAPDGNGFYITAYGDTDFYPGGTLLVNTGTWTIYPGYDAWLTITQGYFPLITDVSGTLAATEAKDIAALVGNAGVSGTLATTEAKDTAVFAGNFIAVVSGALATTEAPDAAALAGNAGVSGSLTTTEAPDVVALVGKIVAIGALVVTEAKDIAALAGVAGVNGVLATVEAKDIAVLAGNVGAVGSLVAMEAKDIAALNGNVGASGVLTTTEARDVVNINGTAGVAGTLAATENTDTASIIGTGVAPSGTLAATENADAASIVGSFAIKGTLATIEAADVAAISGSLAINGTLAAIEATDVAAISGNLDARGTLAAVEAQDSVVLAGNAGVTGTLVASEPVDLAALLGNVGNSGAIIVTEAKDTAALFGVFSTIGTLSVTEPPDIAAFLGVGAAQRGVGVWNGSTWVQKPAKVWTGAAWTQKPVKTWNGSAWV